MFQGAYLVAQAKKGLIPDWFVQSPEFFEGAEEEIKALYSGGIGMLPYTGIHLRVGTNPLNPSEPAYMDNSFYTSMIRTGYYIKALEHFPGGRFIVFSDNMELAKTYFTGDRFAFDDSKDDIEAFNKLASCQGQILTNSSFSWWAGYLNPNVDKKIVVPTETSWFADKKVRVGLPEDWIKIDP